MRVGILTLPLWHNYGGILQAHALRQAVENLGHEAVFIDVCRPPVGNLEIGVNRLKRMLRRFVRGSCSPWYPDQNELEKISQETRNFVQKKINPKTRHISVFTVLDMANEFDAVIVGSDQVWRREYMPDLATYCLAFSDEAPRRISYAASLGVDDWRFDSGESDFFSDALRSFDAISVREDKGASLLSEKVDIEAALVCDPTLLFDSDYYCRLAQITPSEAAHIDKIFTYFLDEETGSPGTVANVVQQLGGTALDIMPTPFGPGFRNEPSNYIFPPVEGWVSAFNESSFVVTDSFHGCVFSIIFNRPFIAVANMHRGRSRFEALLKRYGLADRLFDSLSDVDVRLLAPIDWKRVNKVREEGRQDGIRFLRNSLEMCGENNE